jgi:hypothetical protein
MRRNVLSVLALTLTLTLAGCGEEWDTLDSGTLSQADLGGDTAMVVQDELTWSLLYTWVTGSTSAPDVDFAENTVVGLTLGNRPTGGYLIEIDDVEWDSNGALVIATETQPGPGDIVTQGSTRPYTFAEVTTPENGLVKFEKDGNPMGLGLYWTPELLIEMHLLMEYPTPTDVIAPAGDVTALQAGTCPGGGAIEGIVLPMNFSGQDVSNLALYCPDQGKYWIRHEQGAFVGTIVQWLGPFEL